MVIDVKGDLHNLLLTFPTLAASSFEPWDRNDRVIGPVYDAKAKRQVHRLLLETSEYHVINHGAPVREAKREGRTHHL